ncbi:unnamed protein product [Thelazia callipaeda]|uniref:DEK_C domain-containing protein n=1 Tax=Thelazia callipaeda TaxID=103827 RepID=A0A0N5CL40_THECL|nr:unnamed protein product [Thelazia callipaeda]
MYHLLDLSGVETYKYSESLLINHIINGIKKMGNLGFSDKQSFDSIVRGILEEYLPGDILNLINANYMLCDKTVPSKKRRNSNFKNKDDEGEITGDVFKKIQTVDSCTNSVPHKIPRLRENKTLTH